MRIERPKSYQGRKSSHMNQRAAINMVEPIYLDPIPSVLATPKALPRSLNTLKMPQ